MKIDFAAFVDSLQYMGKGMLGIFIVTLAIVVMMLALERLTRKKSGDEQE